MLLSVLSHAKTGPGRGDETNSSLKGFCFIGKDFVMTGSAGTEAKQSHALVEMYTQPIKTAISAAHFSLRGIRKSATAKRDLEIQSRSETGGKQGKQEKKKPGATELQGNAFSECSGISTLVLRQEFARHGRNPRAQKSLILFSTFIDLK